MESIKRLNSPYLSKNPKITFVFEKLLLSEGRGLGFEIIRGLPTEHNLPLPIVTYDDVYLNFSFSRAYGNGRVNGDERTNVLNEKEARGFDYIRLNSPITRKAYEDYLGVSKKTAERHMTHFIEINLIKRVGSGAKITYEIV